MKTFLAITFSVLMIIFTGFSLVGAEELHGTWVNKENNTTDDPAKFIFNADGTYSCYDNTTTKTVKWEGTYKITEKSTDTEGTLWYKYTTINSLFSTDTIYNTARILNSGKTFEFGATTLGYPPEKRISRAFYYYGIFQRE